MEEEKIVEGLRAIYKVLKHQTELLENIAFYLAGQQSAPNIKRPIEEFKVFDWSSIGAMVEYKDDFGPSQVSWHGKLYTRRSPDNKFKEAIWFSYCLGKDEKGDNKYERLITFTKIDPAEPISRKAEKLINTPTQDLLYPPGR